MASLQGAATLLVAVAIVMFAIGMITLVAHWTAATNRGIFRARRAFVWLCLALFLVIPVNFLAGDKIAVAVVVLAVAATLSFMELWFPYDDADESTI